ncbi:hypothetical protein NPIL_279461 [Nephila pilipes]|uniref:Uncharacterized protein n=1 Tax=Nephila pilipes TaxID=299642 RepID=A0A8X6MW80_NEPPI|nr:hypothetical protein NPIL_279461 [Nephila pilipes]
MGRPCQSLHDSRVAGCSLRNAIVSAAVRLKVVRNASTGGGISERMVRGHAPPQKGGHFRGPFCESGIRCTRWTEDGGMASG